MGIFIFTVVLAVIGVLVFVASFAVTKEEPGARWGVRGVGALLVLIFALVTIFSSYHSIGAREVGIPISFGKVGKPIDSGATWQAPWVSMIRCPLTEEYSTQNKDPKTGDALYDQSVPISGSDQGSATADVQVGYHIDAKDVDTVYKLYACNLLKIKENAVAQRVRSDVAATATAFASTDLRSHRQDIETASLNMLQQQLGQQGITVDSVTIADLQLSETTQAAANNKLAAQQNVGVAQLNLQKASIDKQTAVVNAQGQQSANAAQQSSLTPQVLCQQAIQAIAQSKPQIINSWGPCGGSASSGTGGTIVSLPASQG